VRNTIKNILIPLIVFLLLGPPIGSILSGYVFDFPLPNRDESRLIVIAFSYLFLGYALLSYCVYMLSYLIFRKIKSTKISSLLTIIVTTILAALSFAILEYEAPYAYDVQGINLIKDNTHIWRLVWTIASTSFVCSILSNRFLEQ